MMYVLGYVTTIFKMHIAVGEGPIVGIIFAQCLKTNVHPIHGSDGSSFHWICHGDALLISELSLSACLWVLEPAQKCSFCQN